VGAAQLRLNLRFDFRVLKTVRFRANDFHRDSSMQPVVETTVHVRKSAATSLRKYLVTIRDVIVRPREILLLPITIV
jgi:hypothetical protein